MRRVSRSMAVVSTVILAAGVLAACGGDGDDDNPGGRPSAEIIVNGCNPENPLIPGNTAETCGGNILDVTTSKLIHYATEDAAPEMDIAESIDTTDNQNFTVKIKPDYLFSDGTPVTAESFVKAWNWTAYGPNGYQGAYFFEPVEGYADLQCTGPDEEDPCKGGAPAADTMTGLEVVDETTFTIKTSEKVSNLPVRLGYTAFAPMPEVFFEDPEAYGTAGTEPVSAGPYKITEFTENKQIVLEKNAEYAGDFGGKSDKITFKIYTDEAAAYADAVAGNIDIIDNIPTDNLTDDAWLGDFQDRGTSREQGVIQMIGINPTVDKRLENPELRKAISMAVDRATITEEIFAGSATPATGWVSPVVDGYVADQCGEACVYDPEAAKELWDAEGGIEGDLTLTYNGDADHGPWTEAACNSIRQALDVECKATPTVDFATFLTDLGERKVDGMFRQGWQMDYPSIENFLVPLYSKGASSNYYNFDDAQFQELTKQGAAAETLDEANAFYQQAELRLAADMRIIPLWYTTGHVAWSDRVDNVDINAFGVPVYSEITTK
ncbi:MAG TPA: ABC transporter substrate-binding protein [Nocardioides sp.]|nr:ABC transporter substrate-binding protein [Nocardioides sp.]